MEDFLAQLEKRICSLLAVVNHHEYELQQLLKENKQLKEQNHNAIHNLEKILLRLQTLERELLTHDNSNQ